MAIFMALASGFITAALLFYLLFKDWEEFVHCVKFWLTPDMINLFLGKLDEDIWAETKLIVWLIISIFAGFSAYSYFSNV